MIRHLRTTRGAHFFTRTVPITKRAIRTLFADLIAEASNPSRPLFKIERETRGELRVSALCFAYDKPVPFLIEASGKVDRTHGFLLLVEKGTTVALVKTGLDITPAFKKTYLAPVARNRVECAIAQQDAIFEKLTLRNMTTSKLALRAKTLEASDLENAIALSSAGRFIPQGYRVRRNDDSYAASPSTGRIVMRSNRVDLDALVTWAGEMIDVLVNGTAPSSSFISQFARPVQLDQIDSNSVPTYFAVDTMALSEAVWEAEASVRLVREVNGDWRELDKAEVEAIIVDLDQPFEIVTTNGDPNRMLRDETGAIAGWIRFNKTKIALRGLNRPSLSGILVEEGARAVGDDPKRQPLARYLDAENMFTVLFSDLALAYIDGSLFRDEALVGGGETFMRHLQVEPALAAVTSEKGDFSVGQTEFTPDSVFRIVVDTIATEDVLVCDDLGDEWADFIGVASSARPATISFYHAKHGELSLSASAFHDAVGQAIKNLSRVSLSGDMMARKHASWNEYYKNDNITTAIPKRIRGGTKLDVERKIAVAAAAPDVQHRVFIVSSSLSCAAVQTAFATAAAGGSVKPSFVQLYWLLAGFFSACSEIGAVGFIVCQP